MQVLGTHLSVDDTDLHLANSDPNSVNRETQPQISSLDLAAYAYLREALINNHDADYVQDLRANYQNLVQFTDRVHQLLYEGEVHMEPHNVLSWCNDE